MKAYIASPFFNEEQLNLVSETEYLLNRANIDFFSPRNGSASKLYNDLTSPKEIHVVKNAIFVENIINIRSADIVYANPKGIDSGTFFEIGFALAYNIPVTFIGDFKDIEAGQVTVRKFHNEMAKFNPMENYIVNFDENGDMVVTPDPNHLNSRIILAEWNPETYKGISKMLLGFMYAFNHGRGTVYVDVPRKSNLMLTSSCEVREVLDSQVLQKNNYDVIMEYSNPVSLGNKDE